MLCACGSEAAGVDASESEPSTGGDEQTDGEETATATGSGDGDTSVLPDLGYEPCDAVSRVGTFRVKLQAAGSAGAYTAVEGTVQQSPDPLDDHVVLQSVGDCDLVRSVVYECDPPCDPVAERCAPGIDGTGAMCHAKPKNQHAGAVSVTGLLDPVVMEPNGSNFYSNPDPLPTIGFEPGATIVLLAEGHQLSDAEEGADIEPFELQGWGISYLEPDEQVVAEDGKALELGWTPPVGDTPAHVRIELSLNNHGPSNSGFRTWVTCDTEDSGSAVIDSTLMSGLFEDGLSGWPGIQFWRQSADSTAVSVGCVEFLVVTEVGYSVEIPGFVSCSDDADCPEGQICNGYLYCEPE